MTETYIPKYTPKLILEARQVAIVAHGDQTYGDGPLFPYVKHLDDVVDVLKEFGVDSAAFIIAGYLHDSIEDGQLSYNDINKYFGTEVAEMVYCVTDELGRNRQERKKKTLAKTAQNPGAVVLKLADRIANIRHGGRIDMYKKEHAEFKTTLIDVNKRHSSAHLLWKELDRLLGIT